MASIQKTYESQPLAANVGIDLRKRVVEGADVYYGLIICAFDGGRHSIVKEVLLSELPADKQADAISAAQAFHAVALTKVTAEDF